MQSTLYKPVPGRKIYLNLYGSCVQAGFPSPCDDHVQKRLNIHEYLVRHDDYTFMVTVQGDSMRDAGLLPKDVAIVDRSQIAAIGNIVLAVINGEFTIKQLARSAQGKVLLLPANPDYQAIEITEAMAFEIWGVVIGSVCKYL